MCEARAVGVPDGSREKRREMNSRVNENQAEPKRGEAWRRRIRRFLWGAAVVLMSMVAIVMAGLTVAWSLF